MSLLDGIIGALRAFAKSPSFSISYDITGTGYVNKKSLGKLMTGILTAYENPKYAPTIVDGKVTVTHCNDAVRDVAGFMDCHDFAGMNADEIYAFMEAGKGWKEVLMRDAQELANEGSLVVAGLPSRVLDEAHGHVCVIRPGEVVWSEHWKSSVPSVMNVGGQNFILRFKTSDGSFIEAGINGAFQIIPKFFAWEASL